MILKKTLLLTSVSMIAAFSLASCGDNDKAVPEADMSEATAETTAPDTAPMDGVAEAVTEEAGAMVDAVKEEAGEMVDATKDQVEAAAAEAAAAMPAPPK